MTSLIQQPIAPTPTPEAAEKIQTICQHALALAEKATPGPWRAIHGDSYCAYPTVLRDKGPHFILFDVSDDEKETAPEDTRFPGMDADATFVAEIRTLLPALARAMQQLTGDLETVCQWIEAFETTDPATVRKHLHNALARIAASLTEAQTP